MREAVLDASALLAFLREERGDDAVAEDLANGAYMSSANLAEVVSRVAAHGEDPVRRLLELVEAGVVEGAVEIEPVTLEDAAEMARLRPLTRSVGLSLGDRACLALARRMETAAVTADRAWASLDLDVEVRVIR